MWDPAKSAFCPFNLFEARSLRCATQPNLTQRTHSICFGIRHDIYLPAGSTTGLLRAYTVAHGVQLEDRILSRPPISRGILPPVLHGRYRLISPLGEGTFSKLFRAEDLYFPLRTTDQASDKSSIDASNQFGPSPVGQILQLVDVRHVRRCTGAPCTDRFEMLRSRCASRVEQDSQLPVQVMAPECGFIGEQECEKLTWLRTLDQRVGFTSSWPQ